MTENNDYRNKIQDILKRVGSGEKILEPPKTDEIGELIKNKGVQDSIRQIFGTLKESHEQEIEDLSKSTKQTPIEVFTPEDFVEINSQNEAPDIFKPWTTAKMYLKRLGNEVESGPGYIVLNIKGVDGDPAKLMVRLVKNNKKEYVPYIMISFDEEKDPTPAELALPMIQKVGIKINENSVVETNSHIYVEFSV